MRGLPSLAAHLELMCELFIEGGLYGVTEQTRADAVAPTVAADSGRHRGSSRVSALAAWLRPALFRQAAAQPIGWRHILGGGASLIAGAAVSLARTEGAGALNTTWIEDPGKFLHEAPWRPVVTTLTTPINGYYEAMPARARRGPRSSRRLTKDARSQLWVITSTATSGGR